MMKIASVLVVVACAPPTSPNAPIAPMLPEPTAAGSGSGSAVNDNDLQASTEPVVWPAYPDIPAVPASQPTGAPIALPVPNVKIGALEHRVYTSRFEEHYTHESTTRYQLTKRDFDLDLKTLQVSNGQPTQFEVTARKSREWVALANRPTLEPRQDMELLDGTYQVEEDGVSRGVVRIEGREREELTSMFGTELEAGGDPMSGFMRARKLRLGEVVALSEAERTKFGGTGEGTYVISIIAVDAKTVTYALDIDRVEKPGGTMWVEIRARGAITFDRATGLRTTQVTRVHSVEHSDGAIDDTFSENEISIKR